MKTIEEINEIAPYHPCEFQQGYSIWQSGYMEGQKNGASEQKAIDDAELHQRFEKVLNGQKWDLIDKACRCYCDNICEMGRSGMCYHKYDGKGQIKSAFKYNECNELQLIYRIMEE